MRFDPKLLVIACNTAAAAALQTLRTRMPVPVCGVVEPGAVAAICQALRAPPERIRQGIAVLATESTVNSRAYPEAIRAFCPRLAVVQQPCPLLVPLAEEGRTPDDPVVRLVLSEYLRPMQLQPPAAVLLGCTHYPLFAPAIAGVLGGHTPLVDSARAAVRAVVRTLAEADLLSPRPAVGTLRCYVSDNAERFSRVGSRFLGRSLSGVTEIALEDLQTHDLPGRPVLESLADCPAS